MNEESIDVQKQIEKRMQELPSDVREAILSSDFNQKIQSIGSASGLHLDQMEDVGNFTMLVMLGFMGVDDFQREIESVVGGDSVLSQKIVTSINTQIFLPIRESMKKYQAGQGAEAPAQTPPMAPTPPAPPPPPSPAISAAPPTPPPQAQSPSPTPAAPPQPKVDLHPADTMLMKPTSVSVTPKQEPPKPGEYKADPYREPTN